MKWKECRLRCLQTMYANEGSELNVDDTNEDYVAAMPGKANEALHQLCELGRPILKRFRIQVEPDVWENHTPDRVILPQAEKIYHLNLKQDIPDFRAVDKLMLENGGSYRAAEEWELEGDTVLVLPGSVAGEYTLWYAAYPKTITNATPDNEDLGIPEDAAVLVPIYMAAELYKEDDLSLATVLRNQFEDGLQKLRATYQETTGGARFEDRASTTGWW